VVISHFLKRREQPTTTVAAEKWGRPWPQFTGEFDREIPKGYCFHPCHTWALHEGWQIVRVGLDSFAADLFGKIDRIELPGLDRWVRQGQKLMTVIGAGISVDLPSPVEGTLTAVNQVALEDPCLVTADPYREGWIAVIKSPDIAINRKNLVQGAMVAPWMRNSLVRLHEVCSQLSPALAQDGGPPLSGLLARVSPDLRKKLVNEFFMTEPVTQARPAIYHA
jgi:glycine cleavage system H protein